MENKTKGYISAVLVTLITGFSFLFSKVALLSGNPIDILAHRFTLAFISILPIALINHRQLRFSREHLFKILPVAMFYPIFFFSFQIIGLSYSSSSEAGIIQSMIPIFTLILSAVFLRERTSLLQKLFTLISVSGVLFIFITSGVKLEQSHIFGLSLILISVLSTSIYKILIRKQTEKFSIIQLTFVSTGLGFVIFNLAAAVQYTLNIETGSFLEPFKQKNYLVSLIYLGVLSSFGTSFLTNYSLSKITASKMSVFSNLTTIVTIFAGVIFLKEDLTITQIIGAVIILTGVIGANLSLRKNIK